MSRFERKRKKVVTNVGGFEEKFSYEDMNTRLLEMADKSGWERVDGATEEDTIDEFEEFSNFVIEIENIDGMDAEDAEFVQSMYDELLAKSGLEPVELKEFEIYTRRLARYDALLLPIQKLVAKVMNGECEEDAMLANTLNNAINSFGYDVVNAQKKFQEKLDEQQQSFSKSRGRFESEFAKANALSKRAGDAIKDIDSDTVREAVEKALGSAANGGMGFLKGVGKAAKGAGALIPFVGGKKKKKFGQNDKFQEEFQEIYEIMDAFPELRKDLDEMEKILKNIVEKDLEPDLQNQIMLGHSQVVLIKSYDEYIAMTNELIRLFKEEYLPLSQSNSEEFGGNTHINTNKHLTEAYQNVTTRANQLTSSKGFITTIAYALTGMTQTTKNNIKRAKFFRETAIVDFKTGMTTVQINVDSAKSIQKLAEFENLGAQILEAVLASTEAVQSMDQQMSDTSMDAETLQDLIGRASEQLAKQKDHEAKKIGKAEDDRKLLGAAMNDAQNTVADADKGPLLTDGRDKKQKKSAKESFADKKKTETVKVEDKRTEEKAKAEARAERIAEMKAKQSARSKK